MGQGISNMDLTPDGALGIIDMFKYLRDKLKTPAQKRAEQEAIEQKLAEELKQQQEKQHRKERAEARKAAKAAKAAKQAESKEKSPKDLATAAGEPWVTVLSIEIDTANPGQGAFELDWNDIFVARLIKAGYPGKTDQDVVDNWFRTVCQNVVLETYEQEQADPDNRRANNRRDLGNGRTEIS